MAVIAYFDTSSNLASPSTSPFQIILTAWNDHLGLSGYHQGNQESIIPWQQDLVSDEQFLIDINASSEKELGIQQSNNAHTSFWTEHADSFRKKKKQSKKTPISSDVANVPIRA